MKYATLAALSIAIVSLGTLAACTSDTVRDTLGLDRAAPDEFRVVSRPPLSVPPQFTLRPPSDSDVSPNQLPADQKAQALLDGTAATPGDANGSVKADTAVVPVSTTSAMAGTTAANAKPAASPSPADTSAEAQFLKDTGADKANQKIRDVLTEEKYSAQEQKADKPWWDVLSSDSDKPDPVVDAQKEAARIQADEDAGKPVTQGTTPEIKPEDKGILSGILGD